MVDRIVDHLRTDCLCRECGAFLTASRRRRAVALCLDCAVDAREEALRERAAFTRHYLRGQGDNDVRREDLY